MNNYGNEHVYVDMLVYCACAIYFALWHDHEATEVAAMALFRYLQPRDGLPDPKGSLSTVVPAFLLHL